MKGIPLPLYTHTRQASACILAWLDDASCRLCICGEILFLIKKLRKQRWWCIRLPMQHATITHDRTRAAIQRTWTLYGIICWSIYEKTVHLLLVRCNCTTSVNRIYIMRFPHAVYMMLTDVLRAVRGKWPLTRQYTIHSSKRDSFL